MSPPEPDHDPVLDAEALYRRLLEGVRPLVRPRTEVMGVWSGGVWLAERLAADLGRAGQHGVIISALHRDDFGERGLAGGKDATRIPFAVDGAHILLVDDVLYTGRTIRAAINELFDFGRPASVTLAVLIDRGGRELPIEPAVVAERLALPPQGRVNLAQGDDGRFTLQVVRGDDAAPQEG